MATDFSSLDKLMEFGLGIGIATQMMNTMNNMIARTAIPGVGINPATCLQPGNVIPEAVIRKAEYYIVNDDKLAGPFKDEEMAKLIRDRKINNQTFCWKAGSPAWKFAEDIPEINKLLLLNS